MNLKVVYPGTFDPITLGHEDIARRAAGLFSEVVVAVAQSPGKEPFFDVAERVEMAASVLADCPNVTVTGFSGLLMHFVQAQGAHVVIRVGHFAKPQCQQVCPVDCIPFNPEVRESKDDLYQKYLKITAVPKSLKAS